MVTLKIFAVLVVRDNHVVLILIFKLLSFLLLSLLSPYSKPSHPFHPNLSLSVLSDICTVSFHALQLASGSSGQGLSLA